VSVCQNQTNLTSHCRIERSDPKPLLQVYFHFKKITQEDCLPIVTRCNGRVVATGLSEVSRAFAQSPQKLKSFFKICKLLKGCRFAVR